ncbi:pyridoxamine 5'-phosphate oxidase [Knoellia sinensis KCTC 19936]|uniref:Pyridoxamine 5'-phosphate oxidase n=1 Tax=Knoellia sinensis KCTC 19936 TaxID=1385520 RepID=A0A0A0J7C3_9MICO|nr:pyridoxamine 5'-phosphate oxidase family protein [Knoellia sinensis]KGN33290.1 pyridoxamine 5'-phosphate oxidase [Knoellia sinensis KCTC 19936]
MSLDAPTDHTGLRVMGAEECLERLASVPVGRIAFTGNGKVAILPVHHVVKGVDVCFRTSGGSKIEAAADHASVGFEVDSYDPSTRSGWSVTVSGIATVVDDDGLVVELEASDPTPWTMGDRSREVWIRIRTDELSGRELTRT